MAMNRQPASRVICLILATMGSGCITLPKVRSGLQTGTTPLAIQVPSVVAIDHANPLIRRHKGLAAAAENLPKVFYRALEAAGLKATTGENYHLSAELTLSAREDLPFVRLNLKRRNRRATGTSDSQFTSVFAVDQEIQDELLVLDAERLVHKILAAKELRQLYAGTIVRVPEPGRSQARVLMSIKVQDEIDVDPKGPQDIPNAKRKIPAEFSRALATAGFHVTKGFDFNVRSELRLDGKMLHLTLWDRLSKRPIQQFAVRVGSESMSSDLAKLTSRILNSPVVLEHAKTNRIVLTQSDVAAPKTVVSAKREVSQPIPVLEQPVQLAMVPLRPVGSISHETCTVLSDLLLSSLHRSQGLRAIGPADLEALLAMEEQKDLIGCDTTACAAEIGAALGARYVLYGRIGPIGTRYNIALNVVDAQTGSVAVRVNRLVIKNDDDLANEIPNLASEVVQELNRFQAEGS